MAANIQSENHINCSNYQLGHGKFGPIFSGNFMGATVAVKRIPKTLFREAGAKVMMQLNHPNIVKLFHVQADESYVNVALELCCGTLFDCFSGKYTGPVPHHMEGLLQMTSGLCHLHSMNLVHGGIKPENILIANPHVQVTFKIADFMLSWNAPNEPGSTLFFSPPEYFSVNESSSVLHLASLSSAGDVFALGCVFYVFLTRGFHPFGVAQHIRDNIVKHQFDLSGLHPTHVAKSMIHQMLTRNPVERPNVLQIFNYLKLRYVRVKVRNYVVSCYAGHFRGDVNCCSFHPNQPLLACGLDKATVCMFSSNKEDTFSVWQRRRLSVSKNKSNSSFVWRIEWNVDGTRLCAGLFDGAVTTWNMMTTKCISHGGHRNTVTSISWNKEDASLFLTGDENGLIILRDALKRSLIQQFNFHSGGVRDLVWMSADTFASSSSDRTVQICRVGFDSPITTCNHQHSVFNIQWKSNCLASTSFDGHLRLWSLNPDQLLKELKTNGSPICTMDWYWVENSQTCVQQTSLSSSLIACGHGDGLVAVWDLQLPDVPPLTLSGHASAIEHVLFSPNGRFLATVDQSGKILVWITETWQIAAHTKISGTFLKSLTWNVSSQVLAVANTSSEVRVLEFSFP